jgi:hypothetical protein
MQPPPQSVDSSPAVASGSLEQGSGQGSQVTLGTEQASGSPGQGSGQGPQVTLGTEQWRPAATRQQVAQTIGGNTPTNPAPPPQVHEYAGAAPAM